MKKRPAPLVHVTDHAIVRYLERVENHDVDLVRKVIRRRVERAFEAATAIGLETCAVVTGEAIYRIEDGCVVTVLGPGERLPKRLPIVGGDES